MAVYNCEDYVGEAIESVQAQTFADWELICVDDCSRDRSAEIVREYARQDERVVLLRNPRNMGAPRTRNVALEHACGEFVAILDSDDVAAPRRFDLSIAAFDGDKDLGVVSGMWDVIDDDNERTITIPGGELSDKELRHSLINDGNRLAHSSSMIRRDLMKQIGGYDENLPAAQDYDLFLRLLPHCRFLRLGETLISYRYRSGSISKDQALSQRLYAEFAKGRAEAALGVGRPFDEQRELEDIETLLSPDHGRSRRAARHLNNAALVALYWGDPAGAREMLRRARDYDPTFAPIWLSWMLTYLPRPVVSWIGDMRKVLLRRQG